jgi:hypothetical protein
MKKLFVQKIKTNTKFTVFQKKLLYFSCFSFFFHFFSLFFCGKKLFRKRNVFLILYFSIRLWWSATPIVRHPHHVHRPRRYLQKVVRGLLIIYLFICYYCFLVNAFISRNTRYSVTNLQSPSECVILDYVAKFVKKMRNKDRDALR